MKRKAFLIGIAAIVGWILIRPAVHSFQVRRLLEEARERQRSAEQVVGQLSAMGPAAVTRLIAAIDDESPAVQCAAVDSLGRILIPNVQLCHAKNCVFGYVHGQGRAITTVQAIVPALLQAMESGDAAVRRKSIEALDQRNLV